jgi:hypothetical protein
MSFIDLFRAGACALLTLALSSTIAVAQGNGHGHGKHDRDDDGRAYHDHDNGPGHRHGHGHGHHRYADRDGEIRGWYRAHYKHLPPGLAKRDHLPPGLERQLVVNGTLPPGLQKKVQPCPRELEAMLPPPPPNYVHVVIGGNLVMYNRATFQIGDVFRLDAAF